MRAKVKTSSELRETFLEFFQQRGHLRLPSASLIPAADPTLLLTNAGMAPFKAYFSGELEPPCPRITTVQKSFRTTDIEEVGDATHLTLFEMLGNFSFGNYFKEESCQWGLELMTDALGFEPDRIYITIFENDDEAEKVWLDLGIPAERIFRFGASENWWGPAGSEGPCGPCSELHLYRGKMADVPPPDAPEHGTTWGPNLHDDFIELYNLVFTQFYRGLDGADTPLPKNNIDTGMGLERTITAIQNVSTPYESDLFLPIVARVEEMSGHSMGEGGEVRRAIRVVTEHARSASFLIGDGVVPGNTGRGYVLRRVIRRGMLFGRELGLEAPALAEVSDVVADTLGDVYPELKSNFPFIKRTLELEETNFARTLEFGATVLGGMIKRRAGATHAKAPAGHEAEAIGLRAASDAAQNQAETVWPTEISGAEAFLLYDTYGFPVEVTRELLADREMTLDERGFDEEMERQRVRARAASAGFGGDAELRRVYERLGIDYTEFLGYTATTADSIVLGIIKNGELADSLPAGDSAEIVLRETPFYAEKGGQIGDTGRITSDDANASVTNAYSPYARLTVHSARVDDGELKVGDTVRAEVDAHRREQIRRNHTATHLLHAALREIIGAHVRQAGSLVAPDRLRFDFTHMSPLGREEIRALQDRVNEKIRDNAQVHVHHTTYSKAIEEGALAFFGDTYDNEVRTVGIDHPWSYELCGGTHMSRTGGIGVFVITSESGIGAGVRRLEALTGLGAENAIADGFGVLDRLSATLNTPVGELETRTSGLLEEIDTYRRRVADLEDQLVSASLGGGNGAQSESQFKVALENDEFPVEVRRIPASNSDALRRAADRMRQQMGTGVAILGTTFNNRCLVMAMVTSDLVQRGINAGSIVKRLGKTMGGGGGGGPHLAQAGGRDQSKLDEALASAREVIEDAARSAGGES